jgi:hypothetical protein
LNDKRARSRAAYFRKYNAARGRRASRGEAAGERLILGIDGEGYTLPDGSHRYVYLAACSADGLHSDVRNAKGLTADQVFAWLLSLPAKALLVGFALGYDRTKWVESWPDERVWRLMHEDSRQGDYGPMPVDCEGWRVNSVSTRFTVARRDEPDVRRTVWDVWKFYQCSFVKALSRWKVGTPKEQKFIEAQKKKRGNFKAIGPKERAYCQLECKLLATLAHDLIAACDEAGLHLKSYFGPGSLASLVLGEMAADEHKAQVPDAMLVAVACAYSGGRFECSRVGPVRARRMFVWDIGSAYPWAFTRIPCMMHGRWRHRKRASLKGCHPLATCVRFKVDPHAKAHPAWGPLPHRTQKGHILFPLESAGGWAWMPEYKAAKKLHPGVRAVEHWTWEASCACGPPFAKRVKELFALRRVWGNTSKGLVLKLLLNSLYGKSLQKVGKGRFRCMVRAGLVTAMVRARLLEAVALAGPWDVVELATDSVMSRRPIPGLPVSKTKELGAWEEKPWPGGVFLMRSGLRFPLKAGADVDLTAARGVGPKVLHKNRPKVLRRWQREPMAAVTLATPSFFHGAKLAVRGSKPDEKGYPTEFTRDGEYGRWTSETRTLKYTPAPKRESLRPDFTLEPWRLPRGAGCESVPYGVAEQSAIGDELDRMRELEEEQPDHAGVALL